MPSTCDQTPLGFGRNVAANRGGRRAPFLAPSAPPHIQSASSILSRRSTLIGYEPKLNDSSLFTLLVNAINV